MKSHLGSEHAEGWNKCEEDKPASNNNNGGVHRSTGSALCLDPGPGGRSNSTLGGIICLYNVSSPSYHNRLEKEKAWRVIADGLQVPVEEVKTRVASLRTQFSRLIKPRPSGSGTKPLTSRQRWLLVALDFIKKHIVHRACETTLNLPCHKESLNLDLSENPESSPPSLSTCTTLPSPSSPATPDEGAPPAAPPRGRKCRREDDNETQKLDVLKQMVAAYTERSSHFAS